MIGSASLGKPRPNLAHLTLGFHPQILEGPPPAAREATQPCGMRCEQTSELLDIALVLRISLSLRTVFRLKSGGFCDAWLSEQA
jgi:hypothetical protein